MRKDEEAPESATTVSRRTFLSRVGAAGIAATATPFVGRAEESALREQAVAGSGEAVEGAIAVSLKVNGKVSDLRLDPRTTLLDALRETMSLTGTKKGCDHGQCGACTVHVNGRRVNACLSLAAMHEGDEITTIEGLGQPAVCMRCRRRLWSMMGISAGIALRGRSCRRRRC